jgi:xanthine dehydrogenase accessory factor
MKEITDIISRWRGSHGAALATVVSVEGSAYRRPGARMLILADGQTVGSISGGCIERDVIYRARAVAEAVVVRYDSTSEEESGPGASVGCGGTIDVLIEPADEALRPLDWLWSRRQSGAIVTAIAQRNTEIPIGWRMAFDDSGAEFTSSSQSSVAEALPTALSPQSFLGLGQSCQIRHDTSDGWVDLFVEIIEPPLEFFIFGAGADAVPLAALAKSMGWRVTVVDLRSGPAVARRSFDADSVVRASAGELSELAIPHGAVVVVMNHHWNHDLAVVRRLDGVSLKYAGILGPRRRTERLLSLSGIADRQWLHYPVGLDIGAETPQEVALAIIAEITAVLRGASGGSLRDKIGPIHAPPISPCPVAAS